MTTTTRNTLMYECRTAGGLFLVDMCLPLYALMIDDDWARELAALDYVRGTHVERRDGRPVTLAVTVDGALTWARVEEMQATVDRVFSREMGR